MIVQFNEHIKRDGKLWIFIPALNLLVFRIELILKQNDYYFLFIILLVLFLSKQLLR